MYNIPPPLRLAFATLLMLLSVSLTSANPLQQTLDGALDLSRHKLNNNLKDPVGKQLIEFVLSLSEDNEDALLLLSSIEEDLPVGAPLNTVADEGKSYAAFLASLGTRFLQLKDKKIKVRGLMFMAMAKSIDPLNREARLAMIKAKRDGSPSDLETLIAQYTGKKAQPGRPKTTTGGRSTPVAATDSAESAKTRELLQTIRMSSVSISRSTSCINSLNRFLKTYSIQVLIAAKHLNAVVSTSSSSYGYPYYSSIAFNNGGNSSYNSTYKTNITVDAALRAFCRLWSASYKINGKQITITDPDDPQAIQDIGFLLTTDQLTGDFRSNASKASMKYRNKPMDITGPISKLPRSIGIGGKRTIHLHDDKIQLTIDSMNEAEFKRMKADYDALSNYSRSSSGYYVINVSVSAVCKGQRVGRIVLDDGKNVTWKREYRRTR